MSRTQEVIELDSVSSRPDASAVAVGEPPEQVVSGDAGTSASTTLDSRALWSLLAQHLSSSWGQRCYEFASYLFLIKLFPNTTLQPSIFGFFTTGAAILLSGSVGHLVDIVPRLRFVRGAIIAQKLTVGVSYAIFLFAFLRFGPRFADGPHKPAVTGLFVLFVLLSMGLNLASIGISVAVERDWVTTIAHGDGATLTRLNTYLRRVDLLSKLLAPMFVSLLTTAVSYTFAAAFLLGFAAGSMVFEFIWINLVYRRLPVLALDTRPSQTPGRNDAETIKSTNPRHTAEPATWSTWTSRLRLRLVNEYQNWLTFFRNPIFYSSLSISLLYLTVLSFDGSMLAYLKSHSYPDPFVAGMRAVGVVTGLMGTLAMPMLEKRIGLVRTGTWSVFSEVVTLIPALLAFFVATPPEGKRGSPGNDAMLFTGMALSRIGLWSFDLAQLKELQQALDDHPNRNSIMALQFSLQNMLDLVKYVVTMILNKPSEFKWAVLISFCAVVCGALCYLIYAKKERGHLVHLEWTERLLHKQR
ncbi:hypothetical protein JCM10908_005179 [Rhodotorula pacifica]|uniref:uncharacterized protein n=1 Tax=Rhodotorula pacifica TaxID=1495444 RepID=UPI003181B276